MYCKLCGAEQIGTSNYCHADGASLYKKVNGFTLNDQTSSFCSDCGSSTSSFENYCGSCGTSLMKYQKEKKITPSLDMHKKGSQPSTSKFSLSTFNLTYIKQAILPVVIAFILIFSISYLLSNDLNGALSKLAEDRMEDINLMEALETISTEEEVTMFDTSDVFSASDIMLFGHMLNPSIKAEMEGEFWDSGKSSYDLSVGILNGFLAVLLLPIICIIISGIMMSKVRKTDLIIEKVFQSFGFAVLYSTVLGVLTYFVGYSYEIKPSNEFFNGSLKIASDYSFISALFTGFILAFLFSLTGLFVGAGIKKTAKEFVNQIPYGDSILQGFLTPIKGLLVMSLIAGAYLAAKMNDVKEIFDFGLVDLPQALQELADKAYIFVAVLSVQIGHMVFNLSHLSPFKIIGTEDDKTTEAALSTFGGLNKEMEEHDLVSSFLMFMDQDTHTTISIIAKLLVLIPAGFCVWAGFRMMQRNGNIYVGIAVFSLVYAFIMTVLNAGAGFGYEISSEGRTFGEGVQKMSKDVFYGFTSADLFIRTFLFSYVFALGGTWLSKIKGKG